MKIAITGDFHLGYSEDSLPQARQALAKARELESDAVIVAGDLFDARIPKQEVVHDAVKLFSEHKAAARRSAIAIAGTHERRTKGLSNIIEVLDAAGVLENCHNKAVKIDKNGESVAVTGMAGVPEEYAKSAVQVAGFNPVAGSFNVFVFHQTLREVIPFNDLFMCCEDLPRGFDLYINGHIHWQRELKAHGKLLLMPGSTVITQMKKNETEPKGIWLFDTSTNSYAFHNIESRPFYYRELVFEKANTGEVYSRINSTVEEITRENTLRAKGRRGLVKIKLRGSLAEGLNSGNIDVPRVSSGELEVYIDKEFETPQSLRDKVELLRRLREEEKTVQEMGLAVLKGKLKTGGFEGNVEQMYSALVEEDIEKAVSIAKKNRLEPAFFSEIKPYKRHGQQA